MKRQVWKHDSSGEKYVVEVDEQDVVRRAIGPMYFRDIPEAMQADGINTDPELVDDLNEAAGDYHVDYPPVEYD